MGRLVRRVLKRLRDELGAGYVAVIADGDDNWPVTELPADADTVILTMPMGGGKCTGATKAKMTMATALATPSSTFLIALSWWMDSVENSPTSAMNSTAAAAPK